MIGSHYDWVNNLCFRRCRQCFSAEEYCFIVLGDFPRSLAASDRAWISKSNCPPGSMATSEPRIAKESPWISPDHEQLPLGLVNKQGQTVAQAFKTAAQAARKQQQQRQPAMLMMQTQSGLHPPSVGQLIRSNSGRSTVPNSRAGTPSRSENPNTHSNTRFLQLKMLTLRSPALPRASVLDSRWTAGLKSRECSRSWTGIPMR